VQIAAGASAGPEGEGERGRLFVALELPAGVQAALAGWAAGVARDEPRLRPIAQAALHITLCFLGRRPLEEVGTIGAALAERLARAQAPLLAAGEPLWLPPSVPRALALALKDADGGLRSLQASASSALERLGVYRPERRPYLPHVTIARARSGARIRRGSIELPPLPALERWRGETVALMRSRLEPGGARYEPLWRAAVGGP
jgi:2'-5' RNA ligase